MGELYGDVRGGFEWLNGLPRWREIGLDEAVLERETGCEIGERERELVPRKMKMMVLFRVIFSLFSIC